MRCAAFIGSVVLSVPGCSGWPGSGRSEWDTRFDLNKHLFATLKGAERLTLYEGLPHPFYEPTELKQERESKPTLDVHGYPFYVTPLELKGGDGARLTELVGNEASFRPFGGYKRCGGFHPDYCLAWYAAGADYFCLICFGCAEVKVYGPAGELYCDMRPEARAQLKAILQPYRKNRPVTEWTQESSRAP